MAVVHRSTTMSPKKKPIPRGRPVPSSSLRFSMVNALLLVAGLAAITVGYLLLAGGSTVGAPLLLVLGYVVLIPLGIIL